VVLSGEAGAALALAEEDVLSAQLLGRGLGWIELAEDVELWCRGKRRVQRRTPIKT
jgi:hypothetical protein